MRCGNSGSQGLLPAPLPLGRDGLRASYLKRCEFSEVWENGSKSGETAGRATVTDTILLTFGSRSGSLFALILFGAMFALLGWAVARTLRRPVHALVAGLPVFLFPLILLYVSSLDGFYEARVRDGEVSLSFLLWPSATRIPLQEISEVRAFHAFKVSWRLEIHTKDGRRFESATSNRVAVRESEEILRRQLSGWDESGNRNSSDRPQPPLASSRDFDPLSGN